MAEENPASSNFASFYQRTFAPLHRYLVRYTSGDRAEAQDIAQDAYARVYPQMQVRDINRPMAFLYTTARNLAMDRLRRRARSPFDLLQTDQPGEVAVSGAPSVESIVMAREEWTLLEQAIAGLPAGCRRVFLLRTVERLSHEEIAQRLGLARSSVEKHLIRAMRHLHAAMRQSADLPGSVLPMDAKTGTAGRQS